DQPKHSAPPPKKPKAVPAAGARRAHPDNVPHPPPQSPASLRQPAPPAPCARASTSRPYPQPLRSHIANVTLSVSDRLIATKDHALHPYFVHGTPPQRIAAAPLSLQLR